MRSGKQRSNRGKLFEDDFRRSFTGFTDVLCERLNDQEGHRRGVSAPCDFYVYERPGLLFVELKSTRNKRLEWSRISPNQWDGLMARHTIPGVLAGVLIEFQNVDDTEVQFFLIQQLAAWRLAGRKSVAQKDGGIVLYGTKRRTRYHYDVGPWLERVWALGRDEDDTGIVGGDGVRSGAR